MRLALAESVTAHFQPFQLRTLAENTRRLALFKPLIAPQVLHPPRILPRPKLLARQILPKQPALLTLLKPRSRQTLPKLLPCQRRRQPRQPAMLARARLDRPKRRLFTRPVLRVGLVAERPRVGDAAQANPPVRQARRQPFILPRKLRVRQTPKLSIYRIRHSALLRPKTGRLGQRTGHRSPDPAVLARPGLILTRTHAGYLTGDLRQHPVRPIQ